MSRKYSGDINGRFMFAVQASDDGEFFGAFTNENVIHYYVEDLDKVQEGLATCLAHITLQDIRKLDTFFSTHTAYNYEDIGKLFELNPNNDVDFDYNTPVQDKLIWYSRHRLGKQIEECIELQGWCSFDAEL